MSSDDGERPDLSGSPSAGRDRSSRVIRALSFVGQAGIVVGYGLLGIGLAVPDGSTEIFASLNGWTLPAFVGLVEIAIVVIAAVLGLYVAIFLCATRVNRGDFAGARLPLLWMTVGNFGAAGVGGIVELPALTVVASILGVVYLAAFLFDDRHDRRFR